MGKIKSNKIKIFNKIEKAGIFSLCIATFSSPLLLKISLDYEFLWLGKTAAEVGDAIGGISAPFVGVLAAFLVYKSFEAQIIANKQQLELIKTSHEDQMTILASEMNFNYLNSLIQDSIDSFNYLQVNFTENPRDNFFGVNCFEHVVDSMHDGVNRNDGMINEFMDHLILKLKLLEKVVENLCSSKLDKGIKDIKKYTIHIFIVALLEGFIEEILNVKKSDLTNKKLGEIMKIYDTIIEQLD